MLVYRRPRSLVEILSHLYHVVIITAEKHSLSARGCTAKQFKLFGPVAAVASLCRVGL